MLYDAPWIVGPALLWPDFLLYPLQLLQGPFLLGPLVPQASNRGGALLAHPAPADHTSLGAPKLQV